MTKGANKCTNVRRARRVLNGTTEPNDMSGRKMNRIRYGDGLSRKNVTYGPADIDPEPTVYTEVY